MSTILIGVDPGVTNCGVVVVSVQNYKAGVCPMRSCEVLRCELFNLQSSAGNVHARVPACQCCLRHGNDLASRVSHMVQEFDMHQAFRVVVEQQPPQSAGYATEQLIRSCLVNFSSVAPREIHCLYNGTKTKSAKRTYEERKLLAESYASEHLMDFPSYTLADRKHDMADAFVAVCAWIRGNRQQSPLTQRHTCTKVAEATKPFETCDSFESFIQQFSYSG